MALKTQFVHKTISFIKPDLVSDKVNELVNTLSNQGYKIKIIVHEPIQSGNFVEFSTTILATLSNDIDIGFKRNQ